MNLPLTGMKKDNEENMLVDENQELGFESVRSERLVAPQSAVESVSAAFRRRGGNNSEHGKSKGLSFQKDPLTVKMDSSEASAEKLGNQQMRQRLRRRKGPQETVSYRPRGKGLPRRRESPRQRQRPRRSRRFSGRSGREEGLTGGVGF